MKRIHLGSGLLTALVLAASFCGVSRCAAQDDAERNLDYSWVYVDPSDSLRVGLGSFELEYDSERNLWNAIAWGTIYGGEIGKTYTVTLNVRARIYNNCVTPDEVYLYQGDAVSPSPVLAGVVVEPADRGYVVYQTQVSFNITPSEDEYDLSREIYLEYRSKCEPETGNITADPSTAEDETQTGTQKIYARIVGIRIESDGECTTCDNCLPGDLDPENQSISLPFEFGRPSAAGGKAVGKLRVIDNSRGAAIYTPQSLPVQGLPAWNGTTTGNVGAVMVDNTVRQVKTKNAFVDVVPTTASRYEMRYFRPAQVSEGNMTEGVYDAPAANLAYRTIAMEDVDDSGGSKMLVTKTEGGVDTTYLYEWSAQPFPGESGWTLTTSQGGNVTRIEENFEYYSITGVKEGARRTIKNPNEAVVWEKTTVFDYVGVNPVVLNETVGNNTTSYEYWEDPGEIESYLRVKQITDELGRYEYFDDYDALGRPGTHIRATALGNLTTISTYTVDDNEGDPFELDYVEEKIGNVTISKRWTMAETFGTEYEGEKNLRVITRAVATSNATTEWDHSSNLKTVTYLYDATNTTTGARKNRPFLVIRPDGQGTLYKYHTDAGSGDETLVADEGKVQNNGNYTSNITKGTRTTTVTSLSGYQISRLVQTIGMGSTYTMVDELATAFDDHGRPTTIKFFGNASDIETRTYGCCGLSQVTDRHGIVTTYTYDAAKRVKTRVAGGITTTYEYDAMGRLTKELVGPGGSQIARVENGYNVAGDLIWFKDGLGRNTTVTEPALSDGKIVRTYAHPGNATSVEKKYADGEIYEISGTAVHGTRYVRSVDSGSNSIVVEEIPMNNTTTVSGPFTQRWTDMAGRPWKTIAPSPASGNITTQNYYASNGRLTKTTTTGKPNYVYEYDADLGYQNATGWDLNSNDALNKSGGSDRVRERTLAWETFSSKHSQATTEKVWLDSSGNRTTVRHRAFNGSGEWVQDDGLWTNTTISINRGAATVTYTTTHPDTTKTVTVVTNGRTMNVTLLTSGDTQLGKTSYTYDNYGRMNTTIDARNGTTTYTYDALGRVLTVTTPDPDTGGSGAGKDALVVTHVYTDVSDPSGSQVVTTLKPSGGGNVSSTTKKYYPTGELKEISGAESYPAEYEYDHAGRVTKIYKHPAAGTANVTFAYNNAGLLTSRTNPGLTYTYNHDGQVANRTSARGVVTTYSYNSTTRDLTQIAYTNDSNLTPDVYFSSHDRVGRPTQINDGMGSRTLSYSHGIVTQETISPTGVSSGNNHTFVLTRSPDSAYRVEKIDIEHTYDNGWDPPTPATVYEVDYFWNGTTRHLDKMEWDGERVVFDYVANSTLVANTTYSSETFDSHSTYLEHDRSYDKHDRITSIGNWSYEYNDRGQRTQANTPSGNWTYGYDSGGNISKTGQLTSAVKRVDSTVIHGFDTTYAYDDVGNRISVITNDSRPSFEQTATYYQGSGGTGGTGGSSLNQHGSRSTPRVLEVLGKGDSNVTVNSVQAEEVEGYGNWFAQIDFTGNNSAQWLNIVIEAWGSPLTEGYAHLKANPEVFTYDADGNLLSDGEWNYTWDGENRLVGQESTSAYANLTGIVKEFGHQYDYRNRRIFTFTHQDDGVMTGGEEIFNIYDEWNLLLEVDTIDGPYLRRAYAWGPDLSGTLHGAGGVGGLYMGQLYDGYEHRRVFYGSDANGNIVWMRDMLDYLGEYDYDAFGRCFITAPDITTDINPFRFSTQYAMQMFPLDAEPPTSFSGLYYAKNRWYSPDLGRFISADPIWERGGLNLYGMCGNDLVNYVDPLGFNVLDYLYGLGRRMFCDDNCKPGDKLIEFTDVIVVPYGLPIDYKERFSLFENGADQFITGIGHMQTVLTFRDFGSGIHGGYVNGVVPRGAASSSQLIQAGNGLGNTIGSGTDLAVVPIDPSIDAKTVIGYALNAMSKGISRRIGNNVYSMISYRRCRQERCFGEYFWRYSDPVKDIKKWENQPFGDNFISPHLLTIEEVGRRLNDHIKSLP